jgi:hypothetical protein
MSSDRQEASLNAKNAIAILVIIVVSTGEAATLYKLDDGSGARTSQSISAKTASD